jgi:uncharacterized protein
MLFSGAIVAIGLTILAFFQFWFSTNFAKLDTNISDNRKAVYTMRLTGVICFLTAGVIQTYFYGSAWKSYSLNLNNIDKTLIWCGLLLIPIILLNAFGTSRPDNLKNYPQVRLSVWSPRDLVISASTWVLYLIAYEWLFRGVLLPACLQEMPIWAAIAINVAIYSLVHIPKGIGETIAAIPFGIFVCWISIETQQFWAAILLHCFLALSNEWFSLKNHPEMRLKL